MRTLIVICTLIMLACNPVKRVMQDQQKFDKVAEEVIRRGYCVNDTITVETIKDSIVYEISIIEDSIKVPCADFDTTIGNDGTTIKISSGVLTYSHKCKETIRTKKITNNIRDKSLENILKNDIAKRDSAISIYMGLYEKTQLEVKSLTAEKRALRWKMIGIALLSVLIIFRKQIIKLAI